MGTLTPKIIGIRILSSFKFKKEKEAKKEVLEILKHKDLEPDVNIKNESGWQPLHYAASYGFVDLVEMLCDKGADVNGRDLNSQTPLHKAAMRGHAEVVVALVARDAVVDTVDWHGQSPLELAVIGRHVIVMEILFRLGSDYKLHDYSWASKEKLDKTELKMKDLIKQQIAKYPGYKNKGILKSLRYVDPKNGNTEMEFADLNLTVKTAYFKHPYYLYCSKLQTEYSHLNRYLPEEQKPFSDLFECMFRGVPYVKGSQLFTFVIKLNAHPEMDEEIVFISPHGTGGKIIDSHICKIQKQEDDDKDEELEKFTHVTVAVPMEQNQMVGFALALKEKEPEKFVISKEAVKIQPEAEPDAEIDIPEGAFEDPGELRLKISDSTSVNEERDDGNLLATNVLDMTMSNKQQPIEGKGIVLTLPVHTSGGNMTEDEMCVITTSEEYPENEDDWEVIPAKKIKGKHGTALSFTATHFSIYAGASLEKIKKNKEEVTSGAQRSIYGTKKIILFILLKLKNKLTATFSIIVGSGTRKKATKIINQWSQKEKYDLKQESDEIEINENQTFKVHFDGNVSFHGGTDSFTLAYESKRKENYQIYDFTVKDREGEGYSKVKLEAEYKYEEEEEMQVTQPVVIKSGLFCTKVVEVPTITIIKEPKMEFKEIATLDMKFDIPKLPKPKENLPSVTSSLQFTTQIESKDEAKENLPSDTSSLQFTTQIDSKDKAKENLPSVKSSLQFTTQMDSKDEAMIPALKYVTLRKLSTILTLDDIIGMLPFFGVSRGIFEEIKYDENIPEEFLKVFQILELWRGVRPGAYKVDTLVEALEHIGKEEIALIIKTSAKTNTYPEFYVIEN